MGRDQRDKMMLGEQGYLGASNIPESLVDGSRALV
jgi:hypothetical protein